MFIYSSLLFPRRFEFLQSWHQYNTYYEFKKNYFMQKEGKGFLQVLPSSVWTQNTRDKNAEPVYLNKVGPHCHVWMKVSNITPDFKVEMSKVWPPVARGTHNSIKVNGKNGKHQNFFFLYFFYLWKIKCLNDIIKVTAVHLNDLWSLWKRWVVQKADPVLMSSGGSCHVGTNV